MRNRRWQVEFNSGLWCPRYTRQALHWWLVPIGRSMDWEEIPLLTVLCCSLILVRAVCPLLWLCCCFWMVEQLSGNPEVQSEVSPSFWPLAYPIHSSQKEWFLYSCPLSQYLHIELLWVLRPEQSFSLSSLMSKFSSKVARDGSLARTSHVPPPLAQTLCSWWCSQREVPVAPSSTLGTQHFMSCHSDSPLI